MGFRLAVFNGGYDPQQTWFRGDYPCTAEMVPMRFVDASVTQIISTVDQALQAPSSGFVDQLSKSFANLRDEYKKKLVAVQEHQTGMFQALSQRHATDMKAVLQHNAKIATESFAMMEKHVTEALKNQQSSQEAQRKIEMENVSHQLEDIQETMRKEGTYRDTVFTEHEMSTDQRLCDMETRTADQQTKLEQDIAGQEAALSKVATNTATVKEQVSALENESDKTKEQVEILTGRMVGMESNMKENILEAMKELIRQHRGALQIDNGSMIQLLDAPATTTTSMAEETETPVWDDDAPEGEKVDKDDDEVMPRYTDPLSTNTVRGKRLCCDFSVLVYSRTPFMSQS